MNVRTRFAPSPTGYLHIGGLHTALYAYVFAKQHRGAFLLRIEDTDRSRAVPGAVEELIRTLLRMELIPDEGPFLEPDGTLSERGVYGPYIQSQRLGLYQKYAKQLLEQGSAYRCFCTPERLEEMRRGQEERKESPKYDRKCLALSKEEANGRASAGESFVVRMKVPEGTTAVDDLVYGRLVFPHADVDDQVLLKSDGFPTYHLAVVVDDHLMKISHVMRGEDWISSTPKQVLLYQMFEWEVPFFAHLPNLLNADKKKLSKRQGDVAVEDYLAKGYLPKALLNFVATLGFNPKGDQEIYNMEEIISLFELEKVHRSGAVLNLEKLDWLNRHYLRALDHNAFREAARAFTSFHISEPLLFRACVIEQQRITRLDELHAHLAEYLQEEVYAPELLVWKKADATNARLQLENILAFFEQASEDMFTSVTDITDALETYMKRHHVEKGNVLWPLRVALSGRAQSPSPFELAWVFGKMESIKRIKQALEKLT